MLEGLPDPQVPEEQAQIQTDFKQQAEKKLRGR
jgi:hypothetical protein